MAALVANFSDVQCLYVVFDAFSWKKKNTNIATITQDGLER